MQQRNGKEPAIRDGLIDEHTGKAGSPANRVEPMGAASGASITAF
jgi:hypothetical protein